MCIILIMNIKVKNMLSNSGNKVANQFVIFDKNGNKYFKSYESIIVKIERDGKIILDNMLWDYSTTTSKYRNKFLCESTMETKQKIERGEYKLQNLN